jgi:hypothetical protein
MALLMFIDRLGGDYRGSAWQLAGRLNSTRKLTGTVSYRWFRKRTHPTRFPEIKQ